MKRVERHHLKKNELQRLALQARETMEGRRREVTAALTALVIIGAIAVGYFAWHERIQTRAHALLAQALAAQDARIAAPGSPAAAGSYPTERARSQAAVAKLKAAADAYPSTDAGVFARYQEGATWMTLGDPTRAAAAYQQVIQRAGDSLYGQMARLGLAEAQTRSGQYDQAINTFKELAQRKDGPLPVDGILMQLGRAYLDAGKRADAQQTFNRLVEEYPGSPYSAEAKRELDNLKKT